MKNSDKAIVCDVSVIVPVYNEEANLELLFNKIHKVFSEEDSRRIDKRIISQWNYAVNFGDQRCCFCVH